MMPKMLRYGKQALLILSVLTVLLGVVVPFVFTVTVQLLFPTNASGSLIRKNDVVIGSEIIGQSFSEKKYFWGRLSATTPPYNAAASGASNLSQANTRVLEQANERMAALGMKENIPLALITASGSGLDPHLSTNAVMAQIPRVAKARKMTQEQVMTIISQHIESPHLGVMGVERVNVLLLNLALDAAHE